MKKKVTIVDYGLGNIVSAQQSFLKIILEKKINADVVISNLPEDVLSCTHLVVPGQGAFKSCIDGLRNIPGMINALETSVIKNKKPFLGICVGMQLLADYSFENGKHEGLGWIKGSIKKMEVKSLKLPHIGWNNVNVVNNSSQMVFSLANKDFYFVHSYYFDCLNSKNVLALTNYGINFPSIVCKENVYGVQFHPEKSSKQGLNLIKNFLSL